VADTVCIVAFVAIGRSAHAHGVTPSGMASTSWPFVVGAACGWVAVRAWRRPAVVVPTGLVVWLGCVSVGMILRVVAGQGTAAAFVAVALVFLGLGMLGWRTLVRVPAAWRDRAGVVGDQSRAARLPSARPMQRGE
jgi:FtsH-binding integral membrane protein